MRWGLGEGGVGWGGGEGQVGGCDLPTAAAAAAAVW